MKLIKQSLTKQIATELEEKIQKGEFEVGSKIPTEPELVSYFGVSRNTVREAVQSLIFAGILEARQGDGTYVMAKEKFQIEFFSLLSKTEKQEIQEVRILLEEYIAISACLNATKQDLLVIESNLNKLNLESSSLEENILADISFHRAIALATHNSLIVSIYQYISQYVHDLTGQRLAIHEDKKIYVKKLHNNLFEAIKNKDCELAKKIMLEIVEF
ncbi:MAG: FadR/GntR family transcriptional regulator [Sarcina sp.]